MRLVNPGGSELALEDIINERGEQPKLLETWEIEVIDSTAKTPKIL